MREVLFFAKAPRRGRVKTRLAEGIGDERALALYQAMGRLVVERVAAEHPLTVWFDPPEAEAEMRAWLGDQAYRPQPCGDLGARMSLAFDAHFADTGAGRRLVAIGADAPDVDADVVGAAFRALRRTDVVIGPALDGGYYLIGLKRSTPGAFRDIGWGGSDVLEQTLERCATLDLTVALLEPLRDIDTLDDLVSWGGADIAGRSVDGTAEFDEVE
ncbi:MAG: TIGR04282 family arsenosugar biosynthesis glycosyltransferase [Gemmatimonadota bacterium]